MSVRNPGETLLVTAINASPELGCVRLAVITRPSDIVRVDRTGKAVRWETKDRGRRC